MTIYIDDSGTRPENAVAVAAGWMADTDGWVDFQADWDKARDIDGDKVDSMHMAEFVFGRRGTEFEGWSLEKKQRISARLRGMIDLFGRLLSPEDSNPSSGTSSQVAVLGYEFWQSRFGGALDVVGKQIRVEGHPFTIIGVTRKWFTGLSIGGPPDITIPITAYPQLSEGNEFTLDTRSILWLSVIGRLKDGITIDEARAQLQSFWPELLLATASTETPGPRELCASKRMIRQSYFPTAGNHHVRVLRSHQFFKAGHL